MPKHLGIRTGSRSKGESSGKKVYMYEVSVLKKNGEPKGLYAITARNQTEAKKLLKIKGEKSIARERASPSERNLPNKIGVKKKIG